MVELSSGFEGLNPTLTKALQEAFNISDPTPIQSEAIPLLLESGGGDLVMQAQTGSGKTLAYVLPLLDMILQKYPIAPSATEASGTGSFREEVGSVGLVIVPTRELAAQTQVTLTKLLSRVRPHWIVTTCLTGGDSRKSEKARLRRGCQIVVGTPGRLLDHLRTSEGWRRSKLSWLVIDEADRLADLGFETTIKEIFATLAMAMARLRMVLVSATVTEKLKVEFAGRKLRNPRFVKAGPKKETYNADVAVCNDPEAVTRNENDPEAVTCVDSSAFNAPVAIDQTFLHIPTRARLQVLVGLLRSFFPASATAQSCRVIVFFSCCDSVDFHFALFRAAAANKIIPAFLPDRVKVLRLHGNLEQSNRVATFNEFIKEGKKDVSVEPVQTILFCTDVAARGLDFPNLAGSVQYDAPCDIHDYIHRAGRTGRLSASPTTASKAKSVLFLMPSEEAYVQRLTTMGMKSLRKESFDEYLKWVDKLDSKKLQSILSAKKIKRVKTAEASKDPETPEEPVLAHLPTTLKSRMNILQKVIEVGIADDLELSANARNGFLSSCRAYATHPSAEKDIFHIKRLHLGHLAAAFGLDREPKKMLEGHHAAANKLQKSTRKEFEIPAEFAQGSSKVRKEMRERQRNQHQRDSEAANSQGSDKYSNRLNFSSQKRPAPESKHHEDNDDDDDSPVVFAY